MVCLIKRSHVLRMHGSELRMSVFSTRSPSILPYQISCRVRPKLEKWVEENFRSLVGSGSPFLKDAYGMTVDLKAAEFIPWTTLIERFVFDKDEPYFNIMVPTADTTRWDFRSYFLLSHQREMRVSFYWRVFVERKKVGTFFVALTGRKTSTMPPKQRRHEEGVCWQLCIENVSHVYVTFLRRGEV